MLEIGKFTHTKNPSMNMVRIVKGCSKHSKEAIKEKRSSIQLKNLKTNETLEIGGFQNTYPRDDFPL